MALLSSSRVGSGERSVLLVHGFLGSGRNLATLARQLSARDPGLSVLLPDLTGHGGSPPLPEGANLATVAGDLRETAIAAELLPPWRIIGHSLGGRVALRALLDAPEQLSEVTLLDIAPGPIPETKSLGDAALEKLLAAPAEASSREALREALSGPELSPPLVEWLLMNVAHTGGSYRWRIDRAALAAFHRRTNPEDLWPAVELRLSPVRCLRGARSRYVTDADVARMAAAGCPVETLAGAGHFLHVDAPEALLARL